MKLAIACALVPLVAGNTLSDQVRMSLRNFNGDSVGDKTVDGYMVALNKACQTSGPYWFGNNDDLDQCDPKEGWNKNKKNNQDCRRWKIGTPQQCGELCDGDENCVGFNYVHTGKHSRGFNKDWDEGKTGGTCYFRNKKDGVSSISADMSDTTARDCYVKEPKSCNEPALLYLHCDNYLTAEIYEGNVLVSREVTTANTDGWKNGRVITVPITKNTKGRITCRDDGSTVAGLIGELHFNGERLPTNEETVGKRGSNKLYELVSHADKDGNQIPVSGFTFTPGNGGAWNRNGAMWNNVQKNGAYFSDNAKWVWTEDKTLASGMTFFVDFCGQYAKCAGMSSNDCPAAA